MARKSAHPRQLFDYLNGAVDAEAEQMIEAHLSVCADCTKVAALVHSLKEALETERTDRKSQISNLKSQISREHPDVSELASFFYARPKREVDSHVATHVALCSSCGEEIAQYARAERSASHYNPVTTASAEVPAKAWEMIRDWEDSSFAKLKPASEVLGQELLARLSRLLNEREVRGLDQEISRARKARRTEDSRSHKSELVPVFVVSGSGQLQGVEFFERVLDSTGASVLKHAEGSERFDNKPVHLMLGFGAKEAVVISDSIRSDTIRLERPVRTNQQLSRADYFIIDDD